MGDVMELFSFMGISILILDTLLVSLFLVTFYLGIMHIFNKSFGTEYDLFISFILLGILLIYNYLVNSSFTLLWNRSLELLVIIIIDIVLILFLNILFNGSEKKETESKGD